MKSRAFALLVLALVATHASVASAARFPAQRGLASPFARGHVTSDKQISAGIEAELASAAAGRSRAHPAARSRTRNGAGGWTETAVMCSTPAANACCGGSGARSAIPAAR